MRQLAPGNTARLVTVTGLVLALVACGSDGDGDPSGSVDPDATVRFGSAMAPSQGLDPHRSSVSQDHTFLGPLYDPLIIETPTGELVPGLATEWEFNEAGDVLTMSLREGVTFHDGAELDADAVRANLERAQTVEGSAVAPMLEPVTAVEVVDPLTVELHLDSPDATLPRVLADRPGMMISPDALEDDDLANNPVGAGMFQLAEYRPGDLVRYERFDGYWRPEDVQIGELEIVIQSDSVTRLNALRNDELDITSLDAPQFAEAETAGLETTEFETTGLAAILQLNRTREAFAELEVRQAMNHAVDREAIAEAVYLGYVHPSEQFYPAGFPLGHVPELEGHYPHDPERARELLADAGYPDGFSFELLIPSLPQLDQLGEVLQAQYAEVGITVELRQVDAAEAGNMFYTEQEGDAVIGPYPGRTDPVITAQLYFGAEAHSNPGGHTLDGFEQAHQAAILPAPEEEHRQRVHELMRIAVEQAGNVILVQARELVVTQPEVSGFQWSARGQADFRGVTVAAD